jgi:hypothetical protein
MKRDPIPYDQDLEPVPDGFWQPPLAVIATMPVTRMQDLLGARSDVVQFLARRYSDGTVEFDVRPTGGNWQPVELLGGECGPA